LAKSICRSPIFPTHRQSPALSGATVVRFPNDSEQEISGQRNEKNLEGRAPASAGCSVRRLLELVRPCAVRTSHSGVAAERVAKPNRLQSENCPQPRHKCGAVFSFLVHLI